MSDQLKDIEGRSRDNYHNCYHDQVYSDVRWLLIEVKRLSDQHIPASGIDEVIKRVKGLPTEYLKVSEGKAKCHTIPQTAVAVSASDRDAIISELERRQRTLDMQDAGIRGLQAEIVEKNTELERLQQENAELREKLDLQRQATSSPHRKINDVQGWPER